MLDNIQIGNHITSLRKQKKLTQEELAEKLGISVQSISKWENGHALPETATLPLLSQFLGCSIDSILLPIATRDKDFQNFANAVGGEQGGLALRLYGKLKEKFSFTVSYSNEYYIFEQLSKGASATFNLSTQDDFLIRLDVCDNHIVPRITLRNCSKYMGLIDAMPENVKQCFRLNDCRCCNSNDCPYTMAYTFEGVDYRQCHFIGAELNSAEDVENLFALVCAEHGV
ncbi:MAG: helix-turn-helix transcriptional regulator [Oscillospiraceae bacterium]|nr:helix-turn-helix transcriptional regulator [Oscillospiraceae bacterium]